MEVKLTAETIEAIKKLKSLRLKLQSTIGISYPTMMMCLEKNDPRLTQLDSLNLITETLGKNLTDVIDGPISKQLLK